MKKSFVNWLGLLGIVAFLSYLAAVVFSPIAYPGYNRLSQAVSDLSASNAPSRILWGGNCLHCMTFVASYALRLYAFSLRVN